MSLFKRLVVQSDDENEMKEEMVADDNTQNKTQNMPPKEVQKEMQTESVVAVTADKTVEEEKMLKEIVSEKEETPEKEEAPALKKIRVFDTSPNEDFWFHYGPVVKNLAELREAFLQIDDELYEYHTKGKENDFEKWINDVFGYKELSKKIASAKTRKKAYAILKEAVE
jgi:hypothetical protein